MNVFLDIRIERRNSSLVWIAFDLSFINNERGVKLVIVCDHSFIWDCCLSFSFNSFADQMYRHLRLYFTFYQFHSVIESELNYSKALAVISQEFSHIYTNTLTHSPVIYIHNLKHWSQNCHHFKLGNKDYANTDRRLKGLVSNLIIIIVNHSYIWNTQN